MKQLRLAFGFFTILPFSARGSIAEVAKASYLLPFVAVFLGGAEGLAAWACLQVFGPVVTSAIVLALALLLMGFHHSDGLADVADAVMAGGGKAGRIKILKDKAMGTGAAVTVFLTYLITWAAILETVQLLEPRALFWLFITAEVSARLSLLLVAGLSGFSHEGSGSVFVTALKGSRGWLGIIISAVILAAMAVPLGYGTPLACGLAATVIGLFLVPMANHWFGGANGDLLGASTELGRAAALLAAAAVWLG